MHCIASCVVLINIFIANGLSSSRREWTLPSGFRGEACACLMGDGCGSSASSASCWGLQTRVTPAQLNTRTGTLESWSDARFEKILKEVVSLFRLVLVKTRAASTGITGEQYVSQQPGGYSPGGQCLGPLGSRAFSIIPLLERGVTVGLVV